ncbi:MAG TPA: hypothetical protein DDZ96_05555 [Porphyromonadaceae bacterium]|nr:hypothetical protein [Porphyromonadaceae bacterium]
MHDRSLFVLFFVSFFIPSICAQEADSVSYPSMKISGTLKNKFEYASETGMSRFSVRNSRIGASGNINSFSGYKAQVELSNEGRFEVLDLSGSLKPVDGLSLTLGQTSVPIFNQYIVSPSEMMFANRAFIGKYFLSTRDLGFRADYEFKIGSVPSSFELGIYNGNTINDPVWRDRLSYGARLAVGSMKGFRSTIKYYDYQNEDIHYLFYGADLRYEARNWKLETEIMKRDSRVEAESDMLSYYFQGAYFIPLTKSRFFDRLVPAARWDAIDKNPDNKGFDVNRLTVGLGFAFEQKNISSILRLDYEWYFIENELDILNKYPEMDSDKFTVELVFTF